MPRIQKYADLISVELTGPKGLWGLVLKDGHSQHNPKAFTAQSSENRENK